MFIELQVMVVDTIAARAASMTLYPNGSRLLVFTSENDPNEERMFKLYSDGSWEEI